MPAPITQAFQQLAFQDDGSPSDGFQHSAFQENPEAFQTSVAAGAFQETGFQDTAFQAATVAFDQLSFQGDGFQFGTRPAVTTVLVRTIVSKVRRGRFLKARAHRKPILVRAPSTPTATPLVRPGVQVVTDNRHRDARLIRARHVRARITRSVLADQPPKRRILLEQVTQQRPARTRVRRRKPIILRAPAVTQRPKQTIFHRQRRPVRRTRRPLILATRVAPLVTFVRPKILVQPQTKRARFLTRRRVHLNRAPSVTTPTPLTRPGVQIIRTDRQRPRRFSRLRRKPVVLGSVRGQAASFVPFTRPTILVRRRRTPIGRLRHDQPIIRRSFVAAVRPRTPVVTKRRRIQANRRRRRLIVRPSSVPQFRFTLTQSRRARRPLPRHRHTLILRAPLAAVVVGAIPPLAYGDVLISDREQFTILVGDNVCYELQVSDTEMFLVGTADTEQFNVQIRDQELADVLAGDKPGG